MTDIISVAFPDDATANLSAAPEPAPDAEPAPGPPPRSISGLAVPFNVASKPDSKTGKRYRFSTPPTNAEELIDVVREHDDNAVVGRLAAPLSPTDAGLAAVTRVFATTRGNDTLEEARENVLTGFSVSAAVEDFTEAADGVRDVKRWTARHLGVVRRPAFTETVGLQVAASAQEEDSNMPEPQVLELPTVAELAAQVSAYLDEQRTEPAHPLAEFAAFADYVDAVMDADEDEAARLRAAFALADQTTTDNPGLIVPGWRQSIKANLDRRRPAINALGGPLPLPDTGMSVNWPYFDGDLDAIIAEQATEKTELNSVKVSIKKGDAALHTAGAASDLSYQLLRRSSPAYRAAYLSVLMAAWARYTEAVFEQELAGITYSGEALGTTAAAIRGQLFAASAAVEDATGAPASVVLVASDVFVDWGGLEGLHNPKYGTQNAAGTSSAATLTIDINGLPVRRAPFLDDGTVIVTNGEAARFSEQGPLVATEEDVAKLGQNVAVWGMYVPAEVYFPAGVVTLGVEPAPPAGFAATATSRRTKKG